MLTNDHQCNDCACSSDAIKAARGCPRTFPTTEPGELAPEREEAPIAGTGLVIALAVTFGGVAVGAMLATVFQGAWR